LVAHRRSGTPESGIALQLRLAGAREEQKRTIGDHRADLLPLVRDMGMDQTPPKSGAKPEVKKESGSSQLAPLGRRA
jgi:hypothetical protein